MLDTRIVLSGIWVATMLTYLWGDVLRIMAGDVKLGEIEGAVPTQGLWLGIAAIMLIPIIMVVLTLTGLARKVSLITWRSLEMKLEGTCESNRVHKIRTTGCSSANRGRETCAQGRPSLGQDPCGIR